MYLIIDHFDSFTYNLVQLLAEKVKGDIKIVRSDDFSVEEIEKLPLQGLIISPGPGNPDEYPESIKLIQRMAGKTAILGVCLGHELIVKAFGGKIIKAKRMMHGKQDDLLIDGKGCFRNISSPSSFMRYHSLVADPELPDCLEATAYSRDGDIMAIRHKEYVIEGLQFHPESIGSEMGAKVIDNFITYRREPFPLKATLGRLIAREDLEQETARNFMLEMAEGNLTDPQLAGFLCALEAKGVTAKEIAGSVSVLKEKQLSINPGIEVLDIVGVGGDNSGSFNLSSMSSLVAAACGQAVAKHGGRAVSSFSGAADFFAELGYPLDMSPAAAERLLADTGFAFLFAPVSHSAMRYATRARRDLAVKTVMNLMGPLANPANACYQVMGVPRQQLLEPMAEAAMLLGGKRILVITSADGMDEFSCGAPTHCVLAEQGGAMKHFTFDPAQAGIKASDSSVLKGGTAEVNVAMANRLMSGEEKGGLLDATCLNAGAGLYVTGAAGSIEDGYHMAKNAFASGMVRKKVAEVIAAARVLAPVKKAS